MNRDCVTKSGDMIAWTALFETLRGLRFRVHHVPETYIWKHILFTLSTPTESIIELSETDIFLTEFYQWLHQSTPAAKLESSLQTFSILTVVFFLNSMHDVSNQLAESIRGIQQRGAASFKLQRAWQDAHFGPFLLTSYTQPLA